MVRQFFGPLGVVVYYLPKTEPVFMGEAASQERGQTPSTARFDAVATARRKEIWEALHPEPSLDYGREDGGDNEQVGKVCPPVAKHGHAQTKGFAAATAEVTGESKRDINRSVARAEAIGDDLLRLTGTSLDKGYKQYLYPSGKGCEDCSHPAKVLQSRDRA